MCCITSEVAPILAFYLTVVRMSLSAVMCRYPRKCRRLVPAVVMPSEGGDRCGRERTTEISAGRGSCPQRLHFLRYSPTRRGACSSLSTAVGPHKQPAIRNRSCPGRNVIGSTTVRQFNRPDCRKRG
jgi:hypothetical protein